MTVMGLSWGKGDYLLAVSVGLVVERYSATALTTAVAATLSRSSRMIDMDRLLGGCTFLIPRWPPNTEIWVENICPLRHNLCNRMWLGVSGWR